MRILLLKTWLINMGNGFIDKGAKIAIERAVPNAEVVEVGGYPNLIADSLAGRRFPILLRRMNRHSGTSSRQFRGKYWRLPQMMDISRLVDADVAVLSGCVLGGTIRPYMRTLLELKKRNIPLILLGAGGMDYGPGTQDYVKKLFDQLQPSALLTRDLNAYEHYSHIVDFSYSGIDCAFFINDWYAPPPAREPFVVFVFDAAKEPQIDTGGLKVVRTSHIPFEGLFQGLTQHFLQLGLRYMTDFFSKEDILVSDCLEDYLFLYANAKVTYSDRVHACVATLAYGNKARFYRRTARRSLFPQVLDHDINTEVVQLDKERIPKEKERQIAALREAIKGCS